MTQAAMLLLLRTLDLLVIGIEMSPLILATFRQITASVTLMVVENRNPSPDEWRQLDQLRDLIHEKIQGDIS